MTPAQTLQKTGQITATGFPNPTAKAYFFAREFLGAAAGNEKSPAEKSAKKPTKTSPPRIFWLADSRTAAAEIARQIELFAGAMPVFCLAIEDEKSSLDALRGFVGFAKNGGIAVGSAADFAREFPCPEALTRAAFAISPGQKIRIEDLFRKLVEAGYHPTELAQPNPGTFLRRAAGTLDLWPVNSPEIFRISWDFDEIEKICPFDPAKNSLGAGIKKLEIFPQTADKKIRVRELLTAGSTVVRDELSGEKSDPDLADFGAAVKKSGAKILAFSAFGENAENQAEFRFSSVLRFSDGADFAAAVREKIAAGWKIAIATHRADEVAQILAAEKIPAKIVETAGPGVFSTASGEVLKSPKNA